MISFESGVEKDFIYLLDFDKEVTFFEEQPLSIEYRVEYKNHKYTPDFLGIINDENWLFECKPLKYVNSPKNTFKFKLAENWCTEQGWKFKVITAESIRSGYKLKNVKFLTSFSRCKVQPEILARVYDYLSNNLDTRLVDVVSIFDDYATNILYPSLFHLAYQHVVQIPIDGELISPFSKITLA